MSRKEEFALTFLKFTEDAVTFYDCIGVETNKISLLLATTLNGFNSIIIDIFFEELRFIENGEAFEKYFQPDSLKDDFRMILEPPMVGIANGEFLLSIQVFKELLEEWSDFMCSET
jgi:hypothetical protein